MDSNTHAKMAPENCTQFKIEERYRYIRRSAAVRDASGRLADLVEGREGLRPVRLQEGGRIAARVDL